MISAFIGIDPGFTGAISVIYPDGTVSIKDMPLLQKTKSTERPTYDIQGLKDIFSAIDVVSGDIQKTIILEQQAPFPVSGVIQNFYTGMGYGILLGIVSLLGYQLVLVKPAKWKKVMSLNSSKDLSRKVAIELFPKAASDYAFKLKKSHGRAESLLLAFYGKQIYGR